MDVSEVAPGLWVGSNFYIGDRDRHFDAVFDFSTHGYDDPYGCSVYVRVAFDDGLEIPEILEPLAAIARDLSEQGSVLSLCDAGRNRSALFAVMVLSEPGEAEAAIEQVRAARAESLDRSGGALTNQAFVDYLMSRGSSH